jgi:hypothetical protein
MFSGFLGAENIILGNHSVGIVPLLQRRNGDAKPQSCSADKFAHLLFFNPPVRLISHFEWWA